MYVNMCTQSLHKNKETVIGIVNIYKTKINIIAQLS